MYIYSMSNFLLFPTPNPPTYMHAITYSCSKHSCPAISSITSISVGFIFNICFKLSKVGFIFNICFKLSKSVGGCPWKLSPANTQYAIHLITSQKAENATEVTKTLQNMTNTSFHVKTVQRALRGTRIKAVTKQKWPFLSKKHRRLRMDFAEAHGIAEFWEMVQKEWNDIPTSVCQNLIESMPRRVQAVLQAKGGYTKY